MRKFIWLTLALFCVQVNSFGQKKDPVAMTVDGTPVTLSEFDYIFKKNNRDEEITKEDLDEYLDMFLNFKLKVTEANHLGRDTLDKFLEEWSSYRKQAARPYLIDEKKNEQLVEEALERLKYEVKASHILVSVGEFDLPEDTLAAYNRIIDLRNRIVKNGESFENVAMDKSGSMDPSVVDNKGDLGYFTAFKMVYPFESMAYNTEVGEVSMPVRTKYGYHIIKVTDKREARGEIKVAHILVSAQEDDSEELRNNAERKINEIHELLEGGAEFSKMALLYSDDNSTARKGGELRWFGPGAMVAVFEENAFSLASNDDYSKPFKSSYGWHIVKRLDYKSPTNVEERRKEIEVKVKKDSRANISFSSFLRKMKKEYKFKEKTKNIEYLVNLVDTNIYNGSWEVPNHSDLSNFLFKFDGEKYTVKDFAQFVFASQKEMDSVNIRKYVHSLYPFFIEKFIYDYEDDRLEEKHYQFKMLMQEYRDGILLFELMDEMVWSKAISDTAGLRAYYSSKKNDYLWPERLEAHIYHCKNDSIAKEVIKMVNSGVGNGEIVATINKESQLNLNIEVDKFPKGKNPIVDGIEWKEGFTPVKVIKDEFVFVNVIKKHDPETKKLNETKGLVINDYQGYLESKWVEELRKKYSFEINRDVIYSLITK